MTRRRQRLVEGFPKAKRAIADGQLRRDRQTSRLQIDEQFPPALRALPHACLEADQFLDALGRRADQNQHAFGLRLHARLQIDAVRPDVDVAARRQIAILPSPIFVFPLALEPRDHRRREIGRVLAQQGRQRLLKIAGGNSAQVENRQQSVEALGSTSPFGQDRRREANAIARRRATIASLRLFYVNRTDSRLDRANRVVPVANHTLAAVRKDEIGVRAQKRLEFRFHRLGDQPTRPRRAGFR